MVRARRAIGQPVVPAVAVVCVVAREDVHQRVDRDVVDIAHPGGERLKPAAVRAHAHDASAAHR